jgi:hypothetical protein
VSNVDEAAAQAFLDAYRAAFEELDVGAIVDLFSYPCQLTSDAGEIVVTASTPRTPSPI